MVFETRHRMRSAVLTKHGAPLELMELWHPNPDFGQVEVRLECSGICGAQLQEIDGHKMGGPLPHLLGHEGCAIVTAVGLGVRSVKEGDKVCLHWRKGDGIQSQFPTYETDSGLKVGAGAVTTFNEVAVISENRCTKVPYDTPMELVALLGCGLSTALGVIENEANLKMGESVLIIGCGGLGLNLILAARMRMASRIGVCDLSPEKRNAAFATGAQTFGCPFINPEPFDVVIDTTGDPTAISNGLRCVAPSGRFFMVGQPKPFTSVPIDNARHLFDGEGCSIKATQGGCFQPSRDIPRYIRAYEAGHLKIEGIVTHRMRLEFINDAIAIVRRGEAGRVLITP